MGLTQTRPRKTHEDLLALGEEVRAELIDGEIYMTPSPSLRHQRVAARLWEALKNFVEPNGMGEAIIAPMDVHLPSGDVVQPDVIYVAAANARILQDRIRGVPDLLIEIVSSSHAERDRIVKRDLFARNGVPRYWIVDPQANTVEVLVLDDAAYASAGYFGSDETLTSDVPAGCTLTLAPIFA